MSLNNAHEGYQYQDLLCAYFILKEVILGHFDAVLTFDEKHIKDDRFDDLVIENGNSIQRKQIKYSNDINEKVLSKDDLSNDSGTSLAIYKLFENWQQLRTDNTEFRLCLAWNSPIEDNIINALIRQENYSSFSTFETQVFKFNLDKVWQVNPENFNRWDNLNKYVQKNSVDRNEFLQFCNELLIETHLPKASLDFSAPDELEKILIEQAQKIGIGEYPNNSISTDDFLIKLVKFSGEFRTRSQRIIIKQILDKLGVITDFGQIEQKFRIDKDKNIFFKEKIENLLQIFRKNQKNILVAEPGAGKSWFLTNLIEYLKENAQPVIRHYCFTEINDDFFEQRVKSDIFFGNLIADIQLIYPELRKEKEQVFASNLNEINLLLSKIQEPLIIVIDGLDHIERIQNQSKSLSEDKTRIIEFISKINIPNHISIILGTQPVNEIKILIDEHDFLQVDLPKWNIDDVLCLANKFKIEISPNNLGKVLLNKSQGNPLYLTYILRHLKSNPNIDIENDFPEYDFNLEKYYDFLLSRIDKKSTTLPILSCLVFSVTLQELEELTYPYHSYIKGDIEDLSPIICENISRGGLSLYHDSFKRYHLKKLVENSKAFYDIISIWLEKKGFYENPKSYRYLFKYLFNSEKYDKIVEFATPDFLVDSLYHGYPEKLIQANSLYFLYTAQKLENWGLLAFFNEFNRTIYSTNSEEYHSQFIENFEIYFENILMLYGPDRANSLLFFNDEMNFDLRTTAKAFSILSEYNYSPNWEKVSELFKNSISIDDFECYLYSIIHNQNKLVNILIKAIEEYEEYFDVCISFLIKSNNTSTINFFIEKLDDKVNDDILLRINKLSLLNNSDFYIPMSVKLKELSIKYIQDGGYLDSKKMMDFYFLVSLYAKYNLDYLIKFELSIKSENFFYNWIKFFIRTFILEQKFKNEDLELHMSQNIEFLCSDIDPYKGEPRAVDFSYTNRSLINHSIIKSLRYIHNKIIWNSMIRKIIDLPIQKISMLKEVSINDSNINSIINIYNQFGKQESLNYYEYAEYYFQNAFLYCKDKDEKQAKNELRKAIEYITTYTFHKDITLSEIVDPIDIICKLDSDMGASYLKQLKYLTDAVINHTDDNKGTRWITIDWFKQLSTINYNLSIKYLISQFIKSPYFWKLDYMLVDFLAISQKRVNPVILNFLYKLSPTNNREDYLNGFLNIINKLKNTNSNLSRQSLISLINRNWNDHYEKLSIGTIKHFEDTCQDFNLKLNIKDTNNEGEYEKTPKPLIDFINQSLNINHFFDLENLDIDEIISFYNKKEYMLDSDFNFLYFYLIESNDEKVAEKIISSLIKKRFPRDYDIYHINIYNLIKSLNLSKELKINLLALNTIYSTDGWMNMFTYQEPLKLSAQMDFKFAKNTIFKHICEYLKLDKYKTLPIPNLLRAFESSGIDKEIILDLYEHAYKYIESRLPNKNDLEWRDIESNDYLSDMNENELAITLIFAKMSNFDSTIQREILSAIHHLINNEINLLIKPVKWLLDNLTEFSQLSIFAIFELFNLEKEKIGYLINQCKEDFRKCYKIENSCINDLVNKIIEDF